MEHHTLFNIQHYITYNTDSYSAKHPFQIQIIVSAKKTPYNDREASTWQGVQTIAVLCCEVQKRASEIEGAEVELVSFTVRCDNRAVTFFVDNSLRGQRCFFFRNAFNAPDLLYFQAVTTAKSSNDRSLAVLTDRSEFYDNAPKQEFEVQSAALTTDECALAEQLFSADDVHVTYESQPDDADFDALRPILITDFTCELADLPEKPNSVKFTWRYDRVTLVNPVADNIFTEPYNFTFS